MKICCAGKSQWITLLCEVLPRALLAELGLARILLGSSGGGPVPGGAARADAREAAENFLAAAAGQISELSSGCVKLIWAVTDNLGDWAVIRRRLNEELQGKANAPFAAASGAPPPSSRSSRRRATEADTYFARTSWAQRSARHRKSAGRPRTPGR